MPSNLVRIAIFAVASVVVAAPAAAQRGRGIPVPPLPDGPIEYRTGDGMSIRVVVLTRGLENPWSLAFLPDESIPFQPDKFHREGMIDPVVSWVPSISTTGMTFYTGDRLSAWNGNLFVGGVRYGEIPGTGRLQRIVFNDDMEEIRRESLLEDLRVRIRDVRQGPDAPASLARCRICERAGAGSARAGRPLRLRLRESRRGRFSSRAHLPWRRHADRPQSGRGDAALSGSLPMANARNRAFAEGVVPVRLMASGNQARIFVDGNQVVIHPAASLIRSDVIEFFYASVGSPGNGYLGSIRILGL